MATAVATPLDAAAAAVAYNIPHTRLAVVDQGGRAAVWGREGRGWAVTASWPIEGLKVTRLAWAAPEHGQLLAGGTADGSLAVWVELPGAGWQLAARLKESGVSVQDVAFAPRELGPLVAAAYADGGVRLFQASSLLAARSWELQGEFQATSRGGAATALSWRQHTPGLPPLLLVGTATTGCQVWLYREALMRWERAASLGEQQQEYGRHPVAAVAWAPTLGRPTELVAVAAGPAVLLWSLTGAADALEVRQVARLQHSASVWAVEWNLLGNWLAASTEGGEVCMWRPDLAGEWQLLNRIVGAPQQQQAEPS